MIIDSKLYLEHIFFFWVNTYLKPNPMWGWLWARSHRELKQKSPQFRRQILPVLAHRRPTRFARNCCFLAWMFFSCINKDYERAFDGHKIPDYIEQSCLSQRIGRIGIRSSLQLPSRDARCEGTVLERQAGVRASAESAGSGHFVQPWAR